MVDYIAQMGKLRTHLSDPGQIDQYLAEGYSIYKVEDGNETLFAYPDIGDMTAKEGNIDE